MKKIFVFVILLCAVFVGIYFSLINKEQKNENEIVFSGTVEATDVRLSFKISGRLKCVLFEEGENIEKGEIVAELDDADQKLALQTAEAELVYNNAVLASVMSGSRKQEIREAKAAVEKAVQAKKTALSEVLQLEKDVRRYKNLVKQKVVSQRDFELVETKYNVANSSIKEIDASIKAAKERLSLVIEGAKDEDIKKALALVKVSEKRVEQARQQLSYTKIYSPLSGKVLTKVSEDGEFINAGTVIIKAADLKNSWVRGYVNERGLGKIKLGTVVDVVSDSYPSKVYKGKITFISDEAEFTPKSVQTEEERIKMMFRIKVSVDNDSLELKPGMPVVGKIGL